MFDYVAYGLHIESELALPELAAADAAVAGEPDVCVRRGEIERLPANIEGRSHHARPGEVNFYFDGVASFRVREGREIVVAPEPDGDASTLRVCLLGPVIAALLHQRGLFVLHASAITIGGSTAVFAGEKGWGKSTLAAYLHARGHDLLSDDVVAIDFGDDGAPRVIPGSPHVKLWPSAVEYLGLDLDALPRVQRDLEKRGYLPEVSFAPVPSPIARIYTLDVGEEVSVEPLAPQDAFLQLFRHSYLVRYLEATGEHPAHFRQCAEVARRVPVYCLRRPHVFDRLPDVAEALEEIAGRAEDDAADSPLLGAGSVGLYSRGD